MAQNKINIAVLLGDPSGIGPELVSKLLSEEITNKANLIVIGEKNILESGNKIYFTKPYPLSPGSVSKSSGVNLFNAPNDIRQGIGHRIIINTQIAP